MRPSFSKVFLVFAALAVLVAARSEASLCAKSRSSKLCEAVIAGTSSPAAAVTQAIQASLKQFLKAKATADRTKADNQCLDLCIEEYQSAIDSLKQSLQYVKADNIGSLRTELSAVATNVENCNDVFNELQKVNPFARLNHKLRKYGDIDLALAAQLN